jgi:chaperonin GroES
MKVKKIEKTSKTDLKPLFDNVLVKPLQAEERTAGGIILPDSAKEKPQIGEVMAVGPGVMDDGKIVSGSMLVKVGQKVLYKKWGGNEVKVGSEEWMLVEQKDILAIVG